MYRSNPFPSSQLGLERPLRMHKFLIMGAGLPSRPTWRGSDSTTAERERQQLIMDYGMGLIVVIFSHRASHGSRAL